MVFLLGCSDAMYGQPMDSSKAFTREARRKLRPGDSIRIIRFSADATEFSRDPRAATPWNSAAGLCHVDALSGSGGTLMSPGIHQALDTPAAPGGKRTVSFPTDGHIGNEYELCASSASARAMRDSTHLALAPA